MPEDLRYFARQDEDYFLENAKITEPIIAEMKTMRGRFALTTRVVVAARVCWPQAGFSPCRLIVKARTG